MQTVNDILRGFRGAPVLMSFIAIGEIIIGFGTTAIDPVSAIGVWMIVLSAIAGPAYCIGFTLRREHERRTHR